MGKNFNGRGPAPPGEMGVGHAKVHAVHMSLLLPIVLFSLIRRCFLQSYHVLYVRLLLEYGHRNFTRFDAHRHIGFCRAGSHRHVVGSAMAVTMHAS